MTDELAVGRGTYGGLPRERAGRGEGAAKGREGTDGGDSRRKLFLPRVLRGKHGNPVTREEGSALFKEASRYFEILCHLLGLLLTLPSARADRDIQTRHIANYTK